MEHIIVLNIMDYFDAHNIYFALSNTDSDHN